MLTERLTKSVTIKPSDCPLVKPDCPTCRDLGTMWTISVGKNGLRTSVLPCQVPGCKSAVRHWAKRVVDKDTKRITYAGDSVPHFYGEGSLWNETEYCVMRFLLKGFELQEHVIKVLEANEIDLTRVLKFVESIMPAKQDESVDAIFASAPDLDDDIPF